jgi:hypothetical protein
VCCKRSLVAVLTTHKEAGNVGVVARVLQLDVDMGLGLRDGLSAVTVHGASWGLDININEARHAGQAVVCCACSVLAELAAHRDASRAIVVGRALELCVGMDLNCKIAHCAIAVHGVLWEQPGIISETGHAVVCCACSVLAELAAHRDASRASVVGRVLELCVGMGLNCKIEHCAIAVHGVLWGQYSMISEAGHAGHAVVCCACSV